MEVFVRSRQSCERCLAHSQHHQLPTWSRRQVLALKNDHFPTSLVMMELHCKLPFPSGPVRHPGLRRYFGPPRCLGTVVVPTWGEGWSLHRCFLPLLPLTTLPWLLYFSGSPFCRETERSSRKSKLGGAVVGNYA